VAVRTEFAAGSYSLELDGKDAGPLRSFSGGDGFADVVAEPSQTYFAKKHIANVKWTPLKLAVGFPMSAVLSDWIEETLNGKYVRHNGAVDQRDAQGAAAGRVTFTNARISAVTFPALDGSSKEGAYLTLELTPDQVGRGKGAGAKPGVLPKQKPWLASGFRLELDGLVTNRVSRIDGFTIRQTILDSPIGSIRTPALAAAAPAPAAPAPPLAATRARLAEPTSVEFPNLSVTLASAGAASWKAWFEDFVVNGHSADANEKNGTLRFLGTDLKEELAALHLYNVGIFQLTTMPPASATAVARVVAGLYCERIELSVP
jgi:hypothetical protein